MLHYYIIVQADDDHDVIMMMMTMMMVMMMMIWKMRITSATISPFSACTMATPPTREIWSNASINSASRIILSLSNDDDGDDDEEEDGEKLYDHSTNSV